MRARHFTIAALAVTALAEINGIVNGKDGDTISELIQTTFRTDTKAGKVAFTAAMVAFTAWFIPHIIGEDE